MKTKNLYLLVLILSVCTIKADTDKNSFQIKDKGENNKPNVILIMADDMGFGNVGAFGATRMKTPNLDALAASGIKLTDFHSNCSICSPTRAAFLTGLYQQRVGDGVDFGSVSTTSMRRAQEAGKLPGKGMVPEEFTIADAFRDAGYKTALFGKWHIGYGKQHNPVNNGFDVFRGYVSGNVDLFSKIDSIGKRDWWNGLELEHEDTYLTELITTHSIDFIDKSVAEEKPFMIYLAHIAPHYPLQGPDDEVWRVEGKSRDGNIELSKTPQQDADRERIMVEAMDDEIGRLMAYLDEKGLAENTIVLFCADNGPAGRFCAKGFYVPLNTQSSAGIYRGSKSTYYEGGIRVPGIVSWPGKIPAGTKSDETIMTMDIMPTMLAMTGNESIIPQGHKFDGIDVSATLLKQDAIEPRILYWGSHDTPKYKFRAVREGDWVLVDTSLFNLAEDPSQTTDLAETNIETYERLAAKWSEWVHEVAPTEEKRNEYLAKEAEFKKVGRSLGGSHYRRWNKE